MEMDTGEATDEEVEELEEASATPSPRRQSVFTFLSRRCP